MTSYPEQERRNLAWWPVFVREMFAEIGVALGGKPLDPSVAYDIKGPWPDHRIEIAYVSREEFAAERMQEPEGKYLIHLSGTRFGGGRWEFRQAELDFLVAEALRSRPPQSN
jgi:hypothetical protein